MKIELVNKTAIGQSGERLKIVSGFSMLGLAFFAEIAGILLGGSNIASTLGSGFIIAIGVFLLWSSYKNTDIPEWEEDYDNERDF